MTALLNLPLPSQAKPGKRRRSYPERRIQMAIVRGLRLGLPKSWIVCHPPNGGEMDEDHRRLLAALGVVAGIPDLVVYGDQGGTWFLEVKAPKGRLQPEQRAVLAQLNSLGHTFAVVRSLDEALAFGRVWGWPLRLKVAA